jgi:hypothetical protein
VSAASETASALGAGRGVVHLEVVTEGWLVSLRQLFAMHLDVWRRLNLVLGDRNLQVVGTDLDSAQGCESQVTADEAFLDRVPNAVSLDTGADCQDRLCSSGVTCFVRGLTGTTIR